MPQPRRLRRRAGCAAGALVVGLLGVVGTSSAARSETARVDDVRAAAAPACPWMNARLTPQVRAHELVAAMSLTQEVGMVTGIGQFGLAPNAPNLGAAGATAAIPSLCVPALVLNDASAGMGDNQVGTTAFPEGIGQAAGWDPALARRYGAVLGAEAYAKGVNVVLGPGVDIARNPLSGRNFEYAGEDPYLAGAVAAATIRGIQSQHEIATVKHYAVNDQETDRTTESSDVDQRTLEEIDLPAFHAAVKAGAGSVMCSYNRVNGVYACQNRQLLTGYLKHQLGFRGFVMTDFPAAHSTAPSANAGLDLEMPGAGPGNLRPGYFGPKLVAAVRSGAVPRSRLDDMVFRIAFEMFRLGLFDHVPHEGAQAAATVASTPASLAMAARVAEQGSVLLKDAGGVLPLHGTTQRIAVIGGAAGPAGATLAEQGYGSSHVPLFGYQPGVVAPLTAITARAARAGDVVTYDPGTSASTAAATARAADVAVVLVNDVEVEGADRPDLAPHSGTCSALAAGFPGTGIKGCTYDGVDQDALVSAVARANPNTIVVLQTGGPVTMPWLPHVKAVVENWYPGQVDGDAIAPLLFGDVNFSGRLPITFPRRRADSPMRTAAQYPGVTVKGDTVGPHVRYSERLLVGYRWYQARHIRPLFPFGYGLSYTRFRYSGLRVAHTRHGVRVRLRVTNVGRRAGTAVPQLYVHFPRSAGEPPHQLKDFANVAVPAGRTRTVTFRLGRKAFSVWSTRSHGWRERPGCYGVAVGSSSASLPLRHRIGLAGGRCRR